MGLAWLSSPSSDCSRPPYEERLWEGVMKNQACLGRRTIYFVQIRDGNGSMH